MHSVEFPEVKVKIEAIDDDDFGMGMDENFIDMSAEVEFAPVREKKARDEVKKLKRGPRLKGVKADDGNIITHVVNGVTHYQCRVCDRVVLKKAQIKQHVQIHTTVSSREILESFRFEVLNFRKGRFAVRIVE